MKSRQQTSTQHRSRTTGSPWDRLARGQLSLLALPAAMAGVISWHTFASLGDLPLSLVLGSVGFVILTPLIASMSDRDRNRHIK